VIQIYDTTLRDGTQREDISLSCNDKLRIAKALDAFGVAYIEGGWPGSNPKDIEFFKRAQNLELKNALLTAFGATCRADATPAEDANIQALLEAGTSVCTLVGKTWMLHVLEVLRTTPENNLRIIAESIAYLKENGRRVIYDAEHFFDGYQADPEYAIATLKAAIQGGAETLVLCETNGGALPGVVSRIVNEVRAVVDHPLGIHAHNDNECAVANSLAALQAGCIQVQGTINGYGERCGNANLCTIIPTLELKLNQRCLADGQLVRISELSHFVAEIVNLAPDEHLAYVGNSAFAHKGGIHVAAMRRSQQSYQHVDPARVGNHMRVVVSELAGRGNLISKAEEFNLNSPTSENIGEVLEEIKQLESHGFSFEAAEASVVLRLKRQEEGYTPPFEMIDFSVNVEHRRGRGIFAEASVKVKIGEEIFHTVAEGNGPVNALDLALRKALLLSYPTVDHFHLSDYKVRILDGANGTEAITRVLIDTRNTTKQWSTVGASQNIIESSWQALSDSFEYGLMVAQ
jgi:2-isopropylmalate synthase